jgi:selenocysteine lyase/cysteine desulfurase
MNKPDIVHEFPLDQDIIYLNHAAVAPWPVRTTRAITNFANENTTRGATNYPDWVIIEKRTKEQLQQLINAGSTEEIALLKNTSEALSLIAYGLDWQTGDNIVTSDQEFPSNRIVWESLKNKGVDLLEVNLSQGSSPEDAIIASTNDNTRLITISSVQYATGLRMDLAKLGRYCHENNILFCVDAIQSLGAVQFDVEDIHADFVMADAHKWMLAPEGIALFYCRADKRNLLQLNQFGWHMIENYLDYNTREWEIAHSSRRFECGSPNMLGIHALNASLSLLLEMGMKHVEKALLDNTLYLANAIKALNDYTLISSTEPEQLAGIVTFGHNTADPSALFQYLKSNHVICAERGGGIRFSPHFYTPKETMDRAIELLVMFKAGD